MMESMVMVLRLSLPKVRATPKAPMAMPMEPLMSSGLRPSFSTVNTATRVNEMLTTPMMTVCIIGLAMPMSVKMRGA